MNYEEKEPIPAGDWNELSHAQKNDVRELQEGLAKVIIYEIEDFYKAHPELKIEFGLQVEAHLRVKPVFHGRVTLRFEHDGVIYEGTAYAVEKVAK